ncbi:MAG TPA: RecQ family ATP-dependent DNA helicase [Bacillota bacterium]|nr:RecQ family ATP-dependent DNA helicase [Bacillota bacterium]
MIQKQQLKKDLYTYFHKHSFLPGQQEIIEDILAGRNVLGILPTGSGKSLCYQLPAKKLPGTTIIVSPLISLMTDQVKQLKANQFKEVIALNSFMDISERKKEYPRLAAYKLIYISPELLQNDEVMSWLKKLTISLFVVDEAHCISHWGHEFRTDYLRLKDVIMYLGNPVILALSATATKEVREDIIYSLDIHEVEQHIYPIDRQNIIYDVKKVNDDKEKLDHLIECIRTFHVPTIIYFSSRQTCEHIAEELSRLVPERQIAHYHGGMEQMDRTLIQQQFMNDQIHVICATSAFGMGINKQNIRMVVHYHLPAQLESFIQETGRAGRDGKSSMSLLLYKENDQYIPKRFIEGELPTVNELISVWNKMAILYTQAKPIPENILDACHYFQLTETQWRFLFYHMTKHGMIKGGNIIYDKDHWQTVMDKLKPYINERMEKKEKKLEKMIEWVSENDCLRKQLFKEFQHTYTIPDGPCCSNCGYTYTDWNPAETKVEKSSKSWDILLRQILMENGKK